MVMEGQTMGRCRPVSDSEADAMEAHCDGPEELALIRFFRHTAYRSNETASLVVSDLWDGHQVRDRVQIQAKHMKKKVSRRPIPIVPQLKQALLCWFMQLQQSGLLKPDTPIWYGRKSGSTAKGWSRETLWRKVKEIATRAGVLGAIGCHSFRKLFCVWIYDASGRDIMKTASAMGHRQISSTQQYLDSIVLDADMDDLILRAA
jgi:integrase